MRQPKCGVASSNTSEYILTYGEAMRSMTSFRSEEQALEKEEFANLHPDFTFLSTKILPLSLFAAGL